MLIFAKIHKNKKYQKHSFYKFIQSRWFFIRLTHAARVASWSPSWSLNTARTWSWWIICILVIRRRRFSIYSRRPTALTLKLIFVKFIQQACPGLSFCVFLQFLMPLDPLSVPGWGSLPWILRVLVLTNFWWISLVSWERTFIFTQIDIWSLAERRMRNVWLLVVIMRRLIQRVVRWIFPHWLCGKLMRRMSPFMLIFLKIWGGVFLSWKLVSNEFIELALSVGIFRRTRLIKTYGRVWWLTIELIEFVGLLFLEAVALGKEWLWRVNLSLKFTQQIDLLLILVRIRDIEGFLFAY